MSAAPQEPPALREAPDKAPQTPPRPKRLVLHVGLFLATFLTTTAAGAIYVHGARGGSSILEAIFPIADGLSYSVPLMLILLSHEFGHYLVARYHGVDASLPYFIPLPPPFMLGTMGAVIGMRDVTSDRKKLIDICAAGPLAGLLVAIPVLWYGLQHSQVGPLSPTGLQEGNSILYALLKHAVKGIWLPDGKQDIFLHPTAWAGWAGLLVTMLNLIPIGQLDGGHVAAAYFGNRYNGFASRLHQLLPFGALAVFLWVLRLVRLESGEHWNLSTATSIALGGAFPWLVVYLVLRIVRALSGGDNHPSVDDRPLPRSRRLLFCLMVVVFVLVFMPVPIRVTFVGAAAPAVSARL